MKKIDQNKIMCSEWFQSLRNKICNEIEALKKVLINLKEKSQETQTFKKHGV